MNRIHLTANPDTHYVFHMLAVARCGLDGAYGAKYRDACPSEDLAVLKRYEPFLTVAVGEHVGALHGLMVGTPARGRQCAKQYYEQLLQWLDDAERSRGPLPLIEPAREMASVMIRHYDRYVREIWPGDRQAVEAYAAQLQSRFEASRFTGRAEAEVGRAFPQARFDVLLAAPIEGGAEPLDLSGEQQVFGISQSPEDALRRIGRAYIRALLPAAPQDQADPQAATEEILERCLKKA